MDDPVNKLIVSTSVEVFYNSVCCECRDSIAVLEALEINYEEF